MFLNKISKTSKTSIFSTSRLKKFMLPLWFLFSLDFSISSSPASTTFTFVHHISLLFLFFTEAKIVSISASRKLHLCCVGNFFYKRLKPKKMPSAIMRMVMVFCAADRRTDKKEEVIAATSSTLFFLFAFCTLMSKSEEIWKLIFFRLLFQLLRGFIYRWEFIVAEFLLFSQLFFWKPRQEEKINL